MPKPSCSVCHDTKIYINSRGVNSGDPCHICDPEGWHAFLVSKGIRKPIKTSDS